MNQSVTSFVQGLTQTKKRVKYSEIYKPRALWDIIEKISEDLGRKRLKTRFSSRELSRKI